MSIANTDGAMATGAARPELVRVPAGGHYSVLVDHDEESPRVLVAAGT